MMSQKTRKEKPKNKDLFSSTKVPIIYKMFPSRHQSQEIAVTLEPQMDSSLDIVRIVSTQKHTY